MRLGQMLGAFQEVALMSAGDYANGLVARLCHLRLVVQLQSDGQLQQALEAAIQVCPVS